MRRRELTAICLFLVLVSTAASAFSPIVLPGIDGGYSVGGSADGLVTSFGVRPRLALSWRDRLAGGAAAFFEGRGEVWIPVAEAVGVSDTESVRAGLILPVEEDEVALSVSGWSSFVEAGTPAVVAVPAWEFDYRFLNPSGRLSALAEGSYRLDAAPQERTAVHRVGLGYVLENSIRFTIDSAMLAGVELYPGYAIVDQTGSEIDESRRDVTAHADLTAEGLWGFFTSWSLGTVVEVRSSNATAYRTDTSTFIADPESRISSRLRASVRSSPVRQVTIAGSLGFGDQWYFRRDARGLSGESLDERLHIVTGSGDLSVDYNPFGSVFLVATAAGSVTRSTESQRNGWYIHAQLGFEYSF